MGTLGLMRPDPLDNFLAALCEGHLERLDFLLAGLETLDAFWKQHKTPLGIPMSVEISTGLLSCLRQSYVS